MNLKFKVLFKRKNSPSIRTRLTSKPKLRVAQHMVIRTSAILLLLFTTGTIIYFQVGNPNNALAGGGLTGSFRSIASGNWATLATWQYNPGSGWVAATAAPTTSAASVEICNGHNVTVSANLSIEATMVDAGGTLTVSAGTLTVSNGTGTDLTVNGTLSISGGTFTGNASQTILAGTASLASGAIASFSGGSVTFTINSGATFTNNGGTINPSSGVLIVNSGGTYIHNMNGGTVPTATWNAGSLCSITAVTTTYPSGLGQTFANITFNTPLAANLEMTSNLVTTGNVNITGTGSYGLILTNSNSNRTVTVGGDFNISNGTFTNVNAGGTGTITVIGSFNLSGGTLNMKSGTAAAALTATTMNITGGTIALRSATVNGTSTTTVTGNFSMSAGTVDMAVSGGVPGVSTLNVAGNFSHTGGTITESSPGSGSIVFNGTSTQTYTSGGTVSNTINYTVNSGALLTIAGTLGDGSAGTFTLSSGATININDPAGITTSGATGNVRVSGTRSYSPGANYNYVGTSAQYTGNGLPSTLSNFTVNNNYGLTLSSNLTVSNVLTLTAGTIATGANTLSISNTSASAIADYSSSSYVIGNLQLAVNGSAGGGGFPVYVFPLGTASNYELLSLTLENTGGLSSVTGTFTNANPVSSSYPLQDSVAGAAINNMLDYGYWTLTPNSSMTSGAIDVKLNETGFSGSISGGNVYTVITRSNSNSSWLANGNTQASHYKSGILTANETGISAFGDFGVGYGVGPPILAFNNHTLISGTDLQVGAIYLVQDVAIGLDAWIQITDFQNGATISDFDNWTYPNGYDDAWQPFVNATANDTSSVGWKIMFKVAGTSTDTILPNFTFAAIDVDGDGGNISEFVEAYHPSSISYAPTTLLNFVTQSGNVFAYGPVANIANIDTNQTQGVFKVNYQNVSSFNYRTGAINRGGSTQTRQASLYFKTQTLPPNSTTILPIELLYFTPTLNSDYVELTWATASEINNDYFTVERSSNGIDFEELTKKPGAGNSTVTKYYSTPDQHPLKGINYYRLKQTDYDGHFAYSPVKPIMYGVKSTGNVSIQTIGPNPFIDHFRLNYNVAAKGNAEIQLLDNSGRLVYQETVNADSGLNTWLFNDRTGLPRGTYIVNIISNGQSETQKIIKE